MKIAPLRLILKTQKTKLQLLQYAAYRREDSKFPKQKQNHTLVGL